MSRNSFFKSGLSALDQIGHQGGVSVGCFLLDPQKRRFFDCTKNQKTGEISRMNVSGEFGMRKQTDGISIFFSCQKTEDEAPDGQGGGLLTVKCN